MSLPTTITALKMGLQQTRTNSRGNLIYEGSRYDFGEIEGSRYHFDGHFCRQGFEQYDTEQDAWYFGVWVNVQGMQVLTYAEGDITLVDCVSLAAFHAELQSMADFYGDPPRAFRAIDNSGVTDYYAPRPAAGGAE